jgi:DNA polymerase-3 subunit delta
MAARNDADLLQQIENGEIAPVYVLYGPERYLVDRCLAALRGQILGKNAEAASAFDCDAFDLKETPLAQAVATARTLPMFAKMRLVIARGLDTVKADEMEPLLAYLPDPNPRSCLILLAGEKVDGRLRAFQALKKKGYLHEFARLKDRELATWIAREAKRRGTAMDADAADALANAAGSDLGCLSQAIEQLELYAGKGARITRAQVEDLIPETRERGVFELTKAIGAGEVERALALLTNMLRNRQSPLAIQAMLLRQLRQIWRAKELGTAGASRNEMASAIGLPPYFLDDILTPARRMSAIALKRSFDRLYVADRRFKSTRADLHDVQISRLVRQLAEDVRR